MHLGHLRAADFQSAAAGGIDQLPSLMSRRVLEGRAAGTTLDRLRGLARLGDLVHLGGNNRGIAWVTGEQRFGEDDVVWRAAMAIGVMHIGVAEDANPPLAVDTVRLDQRVLGLAAVSTAVHAQRAADGAGNAAEESKPCNAGLLRGT